MSAFCLAVRGLATGRMVRLLFLRISTFSGLDTGGCAAPGGSYYYSKTKVKMTLTKSLWATTLAN